MWWSKSSVRLLATTTFPRKLLRPPCSKLAYRQNTNEPGSYLDTFTLLFGIPRVAQPMLTVLLAKKKEERISPDPVDQKNAQDGDAAQGE